MASNTPLKAPTKVVPALSANVLILVTICLATGPAVGQGLARFAYGLLLPTMQSDLNWSYMTAGWINTSNAIGYTLGAVLSFLFARKIADQYMFLIGMITIAFSVTFTGLTDSLAMLSTWRIIAGVGTAFSFISGGSLAASLYHPDSKVRSAFISIFFMGPGLGMVLAGLTLPQLLHSTGSDNWELAWIAMGIISSLCIFPAAWAIQKIPLSERQDNRVERTPLEIRKVFALVTGYGFFAFGYIIYITFIVAWLKTQNSSYVLTSTFWITIGMMSATCPLVWRKTISQTSGGFLLSASCFIAATACLIPVALPDSKLGYFISAGLFGAVLFICSATVTAFCKNNFIRADVTRMIAFFTVVFSVCQIFGPILAGYVSDIAGELSSGMIIAAGFIAAGGLCAAFQKPISPE